MELFIEKITGGGKTEPRKPKLKRRPAGDNDLRKKRGKLVKYFMSKGLDFTEASKQASKYKEMGYELSS